MNYSRRVKAASEVGMKTVKVTIILMVAIAVVAGSAFAAPARIGSLEQSVSGPVRVALDSKGNIYVTEAARNLVQVFDSKGHFASSLRVSYPLGIAVDANGTIYVGSDKTVQVLNADHSSAGCLGGATCATFSKPNDIAIDSSGNIYVVDSHPDTSVIRVFDPAGAQIGVISGSGASRLNKPMGITISNVTGEIFVADKPNITSTSGTTMGARIQIFDASGAALRSLGTYGSEVGQITDPVDVALDAAGFLYITDGFQNVVHVMNVETGAIVGALLDVTKPGYNPNGVVVGKNGIAYVVMQKGESDSGRIDLYALDGYVTMTTEPGSLDFEGRQYSGNPAAQGITVTNAGSGVLKWTVAKSDAWIVLGKESGTTVPGSSSMVSVGVNMSSLTPGVYSGTVTVTSDFGQQDTVKVTVNVQKPLVLNVSNGWLTYTAKKGKTAAAQGVDIGIDNLTAPVGWTATSDSTWLAVAPASGTVSPSQPKAAVSVSVNTAGMAVGTYSGVITVSASGVIGDGSTITVNLTITPTTKIAVDANLPEAKFTVAGPKTYSGSGSSWSVEDAPAGDYEVVFEAVDGYSKPLSQMKTLVENGEATFKGKYVSWKELAARKNIVVAKGQGAANDGLIKAYKNTGEAIPAFDFRAMENGRGANVVIGDVDGDGAADLIVGSGPGSAALIRVFRADRSLMLEMAPFDGDEGVKVVAGDFDGNGTAEIIAMPAIGKEEDGLILLSFNKETGSLSSVKLAVVGDRALSGDGVASADIDGDGKAELVVMNGSKSVRVWKVATAGGATMISETSIAENMVGLAVSAGDVDGDGKDEIVLAAKGEKSQGVDVSVLKNGVVKSKASLFGKFNVNGVSLAAADVDGDGMADLIIAPSVRSEGQSKGTSRGQDADLNGQVYVISADGTVKLSLASYDKVKDGVNVTVGDLGL